jgi:hypothetical protein
VFAAELSRLRQGVLAFVLWIFAATHVEYLTSPSSWLIPPFQQIFLPVVEIFAENIKIPKTAIDGNEKAR